jgi:Trk-type K+ transport system membrane component
MLGLLETGSGFWSAIIWVIVALVIGGIVYFIRNKGEESYKKNTEQDKPFISGNPELSKEDSHISASHIFWGFTEALKAYYTPLVKTHTGNINDYASWVVILMVIILIIIGVNG